MLATFARRGALSIYRSTDNGETWAQFSEVANLRGQPSLYELPVKMGEFPAGTILAAGTGVPAADPAKRTLEVSASIDGGKTCGALIYDVAIADGLTRPGMTVVTRDGKGKCYMSYEVVGMSGQALEPRNNLAHFRTSMDGDNFGDFKIVGTLIQDRLRQYPNGTPFIAWSPWGGPDGTLIASAVQSGATTMASSAG